MRRTDGLEKTERKKRALRQQKELDPACSSCTFVMAVLLNAPWANGWVCWLVGVAVFFLSSPLITQELQKGFFRVELLLVCVLTRSTGVLRVTIPFRSIFSFHISSLVAWRQELCFFIRISIFLFFHFIYEQWWLRLSTMASSSSSCRLLPCCHFLSDYTLLPCICLPMTKRSCLSFARSHAMMPVPRKAEMG